MVANQLILRWGDYPGRPSIIASVLKHGSRRQKSQWQSDGMQYGARKTQLAIGGFAAAWPREPRTVSNLSWKRPETGFALRGSKKELSLADTLILPSETKFRLLASRIVR